MNGAFTLPGQATNADDLAAVRDALDDFAAGDRGVDWREFDREFRNRQRLIPSTEKLDV